MSVLALLLAACEEERGAVAPDAVRDLATAVADEPAADPDADPVSDATEEPRMLDMTVDGARLPATERVYFANGGDLWQIAQDGDPAPVSEAGDVLDYSASASGDRLAVLRAEQDMDDAQEQSWLSILLPDGTNLLDTADFEQESDFAQVSAIDSISLNPQGDRLVMTHQNGAMTLVTFQGDVRRLIEPVEERSPGRVSWSSDGRFIAYLDPWVPGETSGLYVMMPERDVRQVLVEPTEDQRGVVDARWVPGTSYIMIIKSSDSTIPRGGDVFLVDAQTGSQQLLMSAGSIAPVAGLADLAISADGSAVAVSGFVPGDERPEFVGLWTIDLESGVRKEVDLEEGEIVTDLWWLERRLLIRTIDDPQSKAPGQYTGLEPFRLLEYDPGSGDVEGRYDDAEEPDD